MSTAHCTSGLQDTRESLRGISARFARRRQAHSMRSVRAWCLDAASKGVVIVVIARALQPRINLRHSSCCASRGRSACGRATTRSWCSRAPTTPSAIGWRNGLRSVKDRLAKLPRSAKWAAGGACVGYLGAYVALARRPRTTSRKGVTEDILETAVCPRRRYWPHPITALNGACATLQLGSRMPYAGCGVLTAPYVERLQLDDGGTVALSWWRCPHQTSRSDVAVVFPGVNLCGNQPVCGVEEPDRRHRAGIASMA